MHGLSRGSRLQGTDTEQHACTLHGIFNIDSQLQETESEHVCTSHGFVTVDSRLQEMDACTLHGFFTIDFRLQETEHACSLSGFLNDE